MQKINRTIILASQSPRRRELLTQAGFVYQVEPSQMEEVITKEQPWEVVMELSRQKAGDIYEKHKSDMENQQASPLKAEASSKLLSISDEEPILVIGADTVVAYGSRILGKPHSEADAFEMLNTLQGNTHQVYTGVTLVWNEADGRHFHTFYEETAVTLYSMTGREIQQYIDSKDCMDKAGSYGIQTHFGVYIKGIEGDYNNVVGLPIARLYQEMKALELL